MFLDCRRAFRFSYPPAKKHIHNQDNFRGVLGLKTYIEERAVEVAKFMIHTNATVRETAKKFGISKSTVHKDITDRVESIDPELAKSVRRVLEVNKAERHIPVSFQNSFFLHFFQFPHHCAAVNAKEVCQSHQRKWQRKDRGACLRA